MNFLTHSKDLMKLYASIIFLFIIINALPAYIHAQEAGAAVSPAIKIGYVDIEIIGKNSLEGKKALSN